MDILQTFVGAADNSLCAIRSPLGIDTPKRALPFCCPRRGEHTTAPVGKAANRACLARRKPPQEPLDAELGDDLVCFVGRIDAVAAQVSVEGAVPCVDRPRVPDRNRAHDADPVRPEGRPRGGPEQKVRSPAAGRFRKNPAEALERPPRETGFRHVAIGRAA